MVTIQTEGEILGIYWIYLTSRSTPHSVVYRYVLARRMAVLIEVCHGFPYSVYVNTWAVPVPSTLIPVH
jgi:hypothetical protein